MNDRSKRFRPTPGLRKEVLACCDKLVAEGFTLTPGVYALGDSMQCCALGAISICHEPLRYRCEVWGEGIARPHERESRMGEESFALSLAHLKCTPWELESIEAGFEGWGFEYIVGNEDGANNAVETKRKGAFQADAYRIGQEVRARYCP